MQKTKKKKPKANHVAPKDTRGLPEIVRDLLEAAGEPMDLDEIRDGAEIVLGARPGETAVLDAIQADDGIGADESGLITKYLLKPQVAEGVIPDDFHVTVTANVDPQMPPVVRSKEQTSVDDVILGAVRAAFKDDVEAVEEHTLQHGLRDVKPRPSGADFAASIDFLVGSGKLVEAGDGAYSLPPPSAFALEKAIAIAGDARRAKTTMYLRHELTREEREDAKARAAAALLEAAELRDGELAEARAKLARLKVQLDEAKKEVEALEGREQGLVNSARTTAESEAKGYDFRNVQCCTISDWRSGYEVAFRLDTSPPEEVRVQRKPLKGPARTGDLFDSTPDPSSPA